MSSILRALKKLELDTAVGRAAIPEIPVNYNSGLRRKYVFAVFVGLFALVVSGAGALYFIMGSARGPEHEAFRRIEKQPVIVGVFQKRVVPVGKTSASAPTAHLSVKPAMSDEALQPQKTATGLKPDSTARMRLSQQKKTAGDVKTAGAQPPANMSVKSGPFVQKATEPAQGRINGLRPVEPAPNVTKKIAKAGPGPKEIGDAAGFKLQAISWSPSPARRIAVINNRICHEGETVEGYVIKEITPDAVFMKKGSNIGKLSFALRR